MAARASASLGCQPSFSRRRLLENALVPSIPLKARFVSSIAWRIRPAWLASTFKKLMRVKPVRVSLDFGDLIVDPVSHLGNQLMRHGMYEPELTEYFRRTLTAGETFIDIGANEGYFSVLAGSLVGSEGRVMAVEPQQRLQERLQANFAANQLRNGQILPLAISDHAGSSIIHLTPDMNTGATGLSRVTKYDCETQSVELIPLSELLSRVKVEIVDTMKMDIEGFEYEAILGAREVFQKHRIRRLAVELHPHLIRGRGLDPAEISEFLIDQGYERAACGPAEVFSIAS